MFTMFATREERYWVNLLEVVDSLAVCEAALSSAVRGVLWGRWKGPYS
jgi:hypothetical protein